MATTTPNFGWPVPTSTDLVKDGATAIEALGDGIDTSMVDLKGGTTGQILAKATNTDMDFAWIANDQGDLTAITAGTGISITSPTGPIPTVAIDSTVATLTGTQTLTNKTLTSPALTTPTISTLTTNGDTIYGTGSGAISRLGIGTTGQVLTVASGIPSWATPSSSGLTSQSADLATTVTMTAANTYYDGPTITLAAGTWLIVAQVTIEDPAGTGGRNTSKLWDGTTVSSSLESSAPAGASTAMTLSGIVAPTGSTTYKVSVASSQNLHTIRATAPTNSAGTNASHISAVKIG